LIDGANTILTDTDILADKYGINTEKLDGIWAEQYSELIKRVIE
jgi:hypothetical protein